MNKSRVPVTDLFNFLDARKRGATWSQAAWQLVKQLLDRPRIKSRVWLTSQLFSPPYPRTTPIRAPIENINARLSRKKEISARLCSSVGAREDERRKKKEEGRCRFCARFCLERKKKKSIFLQIWNRGTGLKNGLSIYDDDKSQGWVTSIQPRYKFIRGKK